MSGPLQWRAVCAQRAAGSADAGPMVRSSSATPPVFTTAVPTGAAAVMSTKPSTSHLHTERLTSGRGNKGQARSGLPSLQGEPRHHALNLLIPIPPLLLPRPFLVGHLQPQGLKILLRPHMALIQRIPGPAALVESGLGPRRPRELPRQREQVILAPLKRREFAEDAPSVRQEVRVAQGPKGVVTSSSAPDKLAAAA
jgi:hypothetical protein